MYNGKWYSITSLRTTVRSWEKIATKLSSYIVWRGSRKKKCLQFRVWLRQSNKMVDLSKKNLEENENPTSSSNKEQGMDKAIKKRKMVKSQPIAIGVETEAEACKKHTQKINLYAHGRKSTGLHYHPPTRKWNVQRTLIMAWNRCLKTTRYP